MSLWWKTFFDSNYSRIWGSSITEAETTLEVDALWNLLDLKEGSLVLDGPCGYGRHARQLAQRGAKVVGVDQSQDLLSQAENNRGSISVENLRFLQHDLREPMDCIGFDAAFNVFSSLGYGSEIDDSAILSTLRRAVRPGGLVFVETTHRDSVVAFLSSGGAIGKRLHDGTLLLEHSTFDPFSGRLNSRWFWAGLNSCGERSTSMRLYTVTELIQMLEKVGFRFRSAYRGCSVEPFKADGNRMGGRIGILAST